MALFGTLMKTWMKQMRLSECLVIWSQTFSLCVGFVFIAYFASFSIPYLYRLFLYPLSILPRFRLSPLLLCPLLLICSVVISFPLLS
jgi:hypothetical protein